jgi:hypothetical protein
MTSPIRRMGTSVENGWRESSRTTGRTPARRRAQTAGRVAWSAAQLKARQPRSYCLSCSVALAVHPDGDVADAGQESNQVRSA